MKLLIWKPARMLASGWEGTAKGGNRVWLQARPVWCHARAAIMTAQAVVTCGLEVRAGQITEKPGVRMKPETKG